MLSGWFHFMLPKPSRWERATDAAALARKPRFDFAAMHQRISANLTDPLDLSEIKAECKKSIAASQATGDV